MTRFTLTFDVEDWFHILDDATASDSSRWIKNESRVEANTDRILGHLSDRGVLATFFCLGWIAERNPALIRRIAEHGHELACHSYEHSLVYQMNKSAFIDDTTKAKQIIEDVSGERIIGYRAPGFSVDATMPWYFDALAECGFSYDSSIFIADRAHGGWKEFDDQVSWLGVDSNILEIPLRPAEILGRSVFWSGGGYFRITPSCLHRTLASKTKNPVFYLHPRDLDTGQPRLSLSAKRTFKYYAGIKAAEARFKKFLKKFEFATCRDVWAESLHR